MPTKKPSKNLARGIGIVLIATAGYLLFTYTPPEPEAPPAVARPAKIMVLEAPGAATARSYPGRVQASQRVDLSFRVAGPLIDVPVRSGDKVEEGTLLARVDPRDFQTRFDQISSSLAEARAQLKAMRVARPENIRIREADVTSAQARLVESALEHTRIKDLVDQQISSQRELDEAQAKFDVAKASLTAAEETLTRAQAGARKEDIDAQIAKITGLEASQRDAKNALDDTQLLAPFTGVVARTYVENYQDVQAKQQIVSLQDVSNVEIVVDVPEAIMAVMKEEHVDRLEAVFDFLPGRTFPVEHLETEIEAGSRTQTYAVTVTMPAPDDVKILSGMSATVQVFLKAGVEGVGTRWTVPADAVLTDESGNTFLWRVASADNTVSRIPVTVGDLQADRITILEGVDANDTIVIAGVHHLRDGMQIRPLTPETK